jgi:formyl-CoA transferase
VFNMMESTLPEYDRCGVIREPSGASLPGIAPTNAYICKDGSYLLIAGNGDGIFKRLMKVIDRPDLGNDPGLAHNDGRVARVGELDAAITAWTVTQSLDEALEKLNAASVPAGRVYTIKDIVEDPQYQAREMIHDMPMPDGRSLKVPGIVPKLSATPGRIRTAGPLLGEHTAEVLAQLGRTAAKPQ